MKQRTNIEIATVNDIPEIRVKPFEYDDFDILLRNLHTLIGISGNRNSCLYTNPSNTIINQLCCSSIAIVEEIKYSYAHLFQIGEKVIISPYLKKYIGVKNLKENFHMILRKAGQVIDDVDNLFYPLICQALAILDKLEDYQNILFLGCNLVGVLLLKMLNERNITPNIFLNKSDVSEKIICRNGVGKVIRFIDGSVMEDFEKYDAIVLNSYEDGILKEIHKKYPYIPVINEMGWQKEHERRAFDILQQKNYDFEDLISHHDHAENILLITEELKSNKYNGKAIIFDW